MRKLDYNLVVFDPMLFVRYYKEAMGIEDQAKRKADYEAYKNSPNYGKTFLEIQRGTA